MLSSVFLLLLATHLTAASFARNWMLEDRLPWEDESDVFNGGGVHNFMSRSRRTDKITLCGGKVWKMVMVTCGGECTSSETDIATRCCSSKCTMGEIMNLCCPSR